MDGFEKLGHTLSGQMNTTFDAKSKVAVEIGVIMNDLSLKVARFDTPIPKSDYKISKHISVDYDKTVETSTATTENGTHSHSVNIPLTESVAKIAENDEVLVLWVENDPVVVDVIRNWNDEKEV